jgi:hypothetical protein
MKKKKKSEGGRTNYVLGHIHCALGYKTQSEKTRHGSARTSNILKILMPWKTCSTVDISLMACSNLIEEPLVLMLQSEGVAGR